MPKDRVMSTPSNQQGEALFETGLLWELLEGGTDREKIDKLQSALKRSTPINVPSLKIVPAPGSN